MTEHTVNSFEEYHALVSEKGEYGTLYRGMRDANWSLIPSIGRYLRFYQDQGFNEEDARQQLALDESNVIRIFRKQSAAYLGRMPADGWEVWSIAQHYGVPTRLLDWTLNPLEAPPVGYGRRQGRPSQR